VADRRACAAAHPRAPVDAAPARLLVNEYVYHPQAQATTRSSSRLVLPVTVTGAPDISRAGKAARTPENVTVTVRKMPLGWTVAAWKAACQLSLRLAPKSPCQWCIVETTGEPWAAHIDDTRTSLPSCASHGGAQPCARDARGTRLSVKAAPCLHRLHEPSVEAEALACPRPAARLMLPLSPSQVCPRTPATKWSASCSGSSATYTPPWIGSIYLASLPAYTISAGLARVALHGSALTAHHQHATA
jgi:hypothetical protein